MIQKIFYLKFIEKFHTRKRFFIRVLYHKLVNKLLHTTNEVGIESLVMLEAV